MKCSLQYASGVALEYSATTEAMTVGLEWPNSFGPTNVTLTSANDQSVTLDADRTIAAAGKLTLQQSSNNFIIASGRTLLINGIMDRKTTGTIGITVNGTLSYNSTGSSLEYTANGNVTIGDEWDESAPPEDVSINIGAGNTLTGSSSKSITNDLNLTVGNITLGSNTLTVAGTVSGSEITGSATINNNTTLYPSG